jgi:DNA-binding Lrp family transcriptional regulator
MVSNVVVEEFIEKRSKKGELTTSHDIARKFGISPQRASVHLKKLEKRKRIVKVETGEKGLKFFKHISYAPKEAIQQLREKYCRDPTLEEIALEMCRDPQDPVFRESVYEIAKEIDWKQPTEEDIQDGQKLAWIKLTTAALVKLKNEGKAKEFFEKYPGILPEEKEKIRKALEYVQKFPELLPKIEITPNLEEKYVWSKEAEKVIGRDYDSFGKKYGVTHFDWDVKNDKIVRKPKFL